MNTKVMTRVWFTLAAACLFMASGSQPVSGAAHAGGLKSITMGTGGPAGVYYALGQTIARRLNPELAKQGYEIKAISTAGSAENVQKIQAGQFGLGLVQSDVACRAWGGAGPWKDAGPQGNIRSIAGLQSEAVSLVCAAASPIHSVADLKGKRVGIGAQGSGIRQNALDVLGMYGVKVKDLALADESLLHPAADKLIKGQLDAFFITIGHPCELIHRVSFDRVPIRFISLKTADAKKAGLPYYVDADFDPIFYPKVEFPKDFLPTMGVRAVLMANKDLPAPVAQAVIGLIYGDLQNLGRLNGALSGLNQQKMNQPLCAPLLPAAREFLKGAGR